MILALTGVQPWKLQIWKCFTGYFVAAVDVIRHHLGLR